MTCRWTSIRCISSRDGCCQRTLCTCTRRQTCCGTWALTLLPLPVCWRPTPRPSCVGPRTWQLSVTSGPPYAPTGVSWWASLRSSLPPSSRSRTTPTSVTTSATSRACASTSFSQPVESNQEVIHILRETYLDLGGDEGNLRLWLQKLLSQNPYILMRPAMAWRDSLGFLREKGFTTEELLVLVSSLRASIAELQTEAMQQAVDYTQGVLVCSENKLQEIVLHCPAVLYYSVPTLVGRFKGLLDMGVSMDQVRETPNVLELTTQIVLYRIQKLASYGYVVRGGSLDVIVGTKKDFEITYGKLQLRQQRPLFNPVAPLRTAEVEC
ncbi:hypothetical protein J4Q44_G00142610 [Coregonus suidteri]|uniref:Uncharacterized protein n=1 Tax=Coregonus suidteri TaxID=861788 RepID=A0AAN8LQT4_9TELE